MLDPHLSEKIRTASDYQLTMAEAELKSSAQTPFVTDALDQIRREKMSREPVPGEEYQPDPDPGFDPSSSGTADNGDSDETLTAVLRSELRDETVDDTRDETVDDTRG
ncbi:hypothetical protein [Halorubrum trapanicum]|uniref:hypothetical protein n=1 Tax=Halorubrum trapanicum TaxID=29284 RepID=UPI000BBAE133|nr:hypothetical protein [Halorubrum trapanicum]